MTRLPSAADRPYFDGDAEAYDHALAQGLSVSGEDKNYFARGRVAWLRGRVQSLGACPERVLDFGCGTGSSTAFLLDLPGTQSVTGVDIFPESLKIARRTADSSRVRFIPLGEYQAQNQIDLAFCNGVFHHIPPAQRAEAVRRVFRFLRPGGLFALWENNPWNPGTRYVMRRIPFDRDAVVLRPSGARALLLRQGFEIIATDFLFIFPRVLRWLRPLEPRVARFPLGAQYQVLARRPLS